MLSPAKQSTISQKAFRKDLQNKRSSEIEYSMLLTMTQVGAISLSLRGIIYDQNIVRKIVNTTSTLIKTSFEFSPFSVVTSGHT